MSDACRQSVKAVATAMRELHAADRNHVWAYYIRNMIRPAVIADEKVDRIIGNPPWLTYGQSADIIRQELRDNERASGTKSGPAEETCSQTKTSPRCSIRAAPNYTPEPAHSDRHGNASQRSTCWTASEVEKWQLQAKRRTERAQHRAEPSKVHEPWDLDNVVPDFFPMPASVVFAQYIGVGQGARTGAGNRAGLVRRLAEKTTPASVGRAKSLHHDDGKFKSPYAELSSQRTRTINDRRLFFVETAPHTGDASSKQHNQR